MSALDEAINTIAALRERVQWLESKARAHEMVLVDERAKTRDAGRALGAAVKEAAALRERVAEEASKLGAVFASLKKADAENDRLRAELATALAGEAGKGEVPPCPRPPELGACPL